MTVGSPKRFRGATVTRVPTFGRSKMGSRTRSEKVTVRLPSMASPKHGCEKEACCTIPIELRSKRKESRSHYHGLSQESKEWQCVPCRYRGLRSTARQEEWLGSMRLVGRLCSTMWCTWRCRRWACGDQHGQLVVQALKKQKKHTKDADWWHLRWWQLGKVKVGGLMVTCVKGHTSDK